MALVSAKEMIEKAHEGHYAVGAFNINNMEWIKSILAAAEEAKSPVMLGVSEGAGKYMAGFKNVVAMVREIHDSMGITVPVALHLDHGSFEGAKACIEAGFTSVMFDGSQMEYDQNVECTRRVVEAAHGAGVSVEGEIGTIGETADYLNGTVRDMVYTSPELARRFVEDTGVDALAVSIGTVHGILPKGYVPKLQLELLKELAAAVPVPLVLHGGSGTPHDEVAAACRTGIHKVNISSEFKHAYYQSVREFVTNHPTLVSPTLVLKDAVQEVRNVAGTKMQVLGSAGKSHCYRKY